MNKFYVLIAYLIVQVQAFAGDPSLAGNHSLTKLQSGRLLLSELRCSSCHDGVPTISGLEKKSPDLTYAGSRISPEYLQRFIASPAEMHPGTTMPDMLASRTESERQKIAESLTHFLVSISTNARPAYQPAFSEIPQEISDAKLGQALYHSIGCVACHGPREAAVVASQNDDDDDNDEDDNDEDDDEEDEQHEYGKEGQQGSKVKPSEVSLAHVGRKYSVRSLSEFLYDPLKVRESGRMPDMNLTAQEASSIAAYLMGEQMPESMNLVPDRAMVEAGREYFQSLNCVACHVIPGMVSTASRVTLGKSDLQGGCLSGGDDSKTVNQSPRFMLDESKREAQREAILTALREDTTVVSEQEYLALKLTAFRCISCHVRDDYGGVHEAHNAYFKGSELNLGDDGRIPPPLTLVGAKLRPTWMKKVLFDGESVRHYMETRMPQFGESNLAELPGLFRRIDVLDGPEMKIPNPESRNEDEREQEKKLRAAGRELLGDKGVNCVACHKFNSKAANVNQGIELLTSYDRLEPAWFYHYLRNPGAFRPRTTMPTAWPDGVSAFTNILDGDSDQQIASIWYYLSLGTSAADPSGVRSVSTRIEVIDRAIVHRGRSRVAGFRGIAVGLPEKLNYAFNAETGTLSAIWQGNFIGVNWSGQGSGDFQPASEPILLAQDVSFALLERESSVWPSLPVMTKEAPANPDPLYPKNLGYQFRGYYVDENSVPTFQYRSGTIEIEDRSGAIVESGGTTVQRKLTRSLQFESPATDILWFRVLVGEISREGEHVYRVGKLRVTIPAREAILRPQSQDSSNYELLLRLEIPRGKSTMEIVYEPLSK